MSSLPTIPEAIARLLDQEIDAEIQPEDPRLLISLSGGVDSVALLIATAQWAKRSKRKVQVEAFHMHHGLRGEEADRDARHCLLICRQWEIPLHVVYEPLDRQLGPGQPSLETLCRHKRREHFAKVAKARDCQWVLLGHHTSDQAETVLGNILRGCGLRGLRGMDPVTHMTGSEIKILRPFLICSRDQIESFLQSENTKGIFDSSNDSMDHRRNRLRHELLPQLEKENPEILVHLNQLAQESRLRWQSLQTRMQTCLDQAYCLRPFISLPPGSLDHLQGPEISDVIREALIIAADYEGQLSREHLEHLEQLATSKSRSPRLDLPAGRTAHRCGHWIHLGPIPQQDLTAWREITPEPNRPFQHLGLKGTFHTASEYASSEHASSEHASFDFKVTLRPLKPEDRWPGRKTRTEESLRQLGIPKHLRRFWPVFVDGDGNILGSPGVTSALVTSALVTSALVTSSGGPCPQVQLERTDSSEITELAFHLLRIQNYMHHMNDNPFTDEKTGTPS